MPSRDWRFRIEDIVEAIDDMICMMCKGSGKIYCVTCKKGYITPPWIAGLADEKCSLCENGKKRKCPVCEGTGKA